MIAPWSRGHLYYCFYNGVFKTVLYTTRKVFERAFLQIDSPVVNHSQTLDLLFD